MIRFLGLTIGAGLLLSFSASATTLVPDSVGVENRNGKNYIVHKVEPRETLYALSRRYNVPVAKIVEANPKIETTINIGQLVYIPMKTGPQSAATASPAAKTATASAAPAKTAAAAPAPAVQPATPTRAFTIDEQGHKIHTVAPKQTLYAISRMHQVTVDDIRKWNGLTSDNVKVGDNLIVGQTAEKGKKTMYVPEPDDEIEKVKAAEASAAKKPVATPAPAPATPAPATKTEPTRSEATREEVAEAAEDRATATRSTENVSKVIETGLAEVINQDGDTNKYLALHKTAPVGTILQVKNVMNGQTVYVRVIGKLPPTGENEKILLRLSKRAYQKLKAIDNRFRVEVSYMP